MADEDYPNVSEPLWAKKLSDDNHVLQEKVDSLTLMVGAIIAQLGGPDAIGKALRWLHVEEQK